MKVLFDTDIGSDIDDSLALLVLLHLNDIQLLGVTTVYGNVQRRAMIASTILRAAGVDVPVHVGIGRPLATRFPIWHTGLEGQGVLTEEQMTVPESEFAVGSSAVEFIAEQVLRHAGEVTIVASGALTNIALAIQNDQHVAQGIQHLVFMGAGVTYPEPVPMELEPGITYRAKPSHNVGCDVEAARRVFESGVKVTVLTNDVTTKVRWDGESVQQLRRSREPSHVALVGRQFDVWLKYRTRIFRRPVTETCPHDALTVAESIHPGRFVTYVSGRISVDSDGATSFSVEPDGPHNVGIDVDKGAFLEWMVPRLFETQSG